MFKNYADINSDIHDDVELTAEAVVPAEDGPPTLTKIPVMTDEVVALCMLTQALAVAFDMGMMTRGEVDCVVARVAKAAARRGR